MRISFNPAFNNKIKLNNTANNINFKSKELNIIATSKSHGNIKTLPLSADGTKEYTDLFVKENNYGQRPKLARAYGKKFSYPNVNGGKTDVYFWQMPEEKAKNTLPASIREVCIDNQVDPTEDIFIVSGINKDNKRYVLFNSNFQDEQTKTNQVQFFYMTSSSDKLTDLQRNAFRIFYDSKNKRALAQNSENNPLAQITTTQGIETSALLRNQVDCWALLSKELSDEQLADNSGNIYPIVYTADGRYTKYRTFKI